MPKETTLRLETYFVAFIEEMVARGRFSSPDAVVQAGLRLLEESESRTEALRAALQEGEDSGWIENFDFDAFLARKNAEFVGTESGGKGDRVRAVAARAVRPRRDLGLQRPAMGKRSGQQVR
jgi:antitoxin ParD1/3/4